MDRKHNEKIVPTARMLRKNMTKEERHLWYDFLRDYPVRFSRQKVLGKYIVDFYCAKADLVIELDGSQHYTDEGKAYDAERTSILEKYGLSIMRFSSNDIDNKFQAVCNMIDQKIKGVTTYDQL